MTLAMPTVGVALSVLIGVALGLFGGGGSILTVPLLLYVFGLGPKDAIATSLLVVAAASLASLIPHARAGNVRPATGLLFGVAGMAGAYAGGRSAGFMDGSLLLLLFAAMMVFTAIAMWRGRRAPPSAGPVAHPRIRLAAQGFSVGLFTGLVGAGGGFVIVPALVLWARLPMPVAVGTSLLVIALNAVAGFSGYLGHAQVDYALAASLAGAAIAGSWLGARLGFRIDPNSLRKGFAGFVLALAAVMVVREANAWAAIAWTAFPSSVPQLVFLLIVLMIGVASGRGWQRSGGEPSLNTGYEHGAGI